MSKPQLADGLRGEHVVGKQGRLRPVDLEAVGGMRCHERVVEANQRPSGTAHDTDDRVLDRALPESARRCHRTDLNNLIVEDETDCVGAVGGEVKCHATASVGAGQTPGPHRFRQQAAEVDPRRKDLADGALCDERAELHDRRRAAKVMVGRQHHARLLAGLDHLQGFRHGCCQRLFAQDVFAGSCGGDRLSGVKIIGRRDVDDVDIWIGEQGIKRVVGSSQAAFGRECLTSVRGGREHTDGVGTFGRLHRRDESLTRPDAGADETPAKSGHDASWPVRASAGIT